MNTSDWVSIVEIHLASVQKFRKSRFKFWSNNEKDLKIKFNLVFESWVGFSQKEKAF